MPHFQNSRVRVLYVEDDPTARTVVRAGLESAPSPGFDVESVGTLASARDSLGRAPFDVILLDLGLPDSDGLEGLTTLRDEWPDLPIVVLTASTYREVGIAALHSGADEFLEKENFDGKLLTRLLVFAIERRRLLEELARHQRHVETAEVERNRLVEAVSQVDDLMIITDTDGLVQYANPAFERITGYSAEHIIGRSPRLLRSGETSEDVYNELWETLTDGETWRGRFTNRRKDGTLYRQATVISPIRNRSGQVSGYVGVGRDVTDEREMEAQLRQSQKLHALGQLSSGVAHDFNNTLAVILTVAGVVKEDLADTNQKASDDIDEIILAARRAEGVVARLLGFSRSASLHLRPLLLAEVVGGVTRMVRAALPSTISYSVHTEPDLPHVLADQNAVEQILLNLVTNAGDAMPEGGELRITVDTANVDRALAEGADEARAGPHVCITVTDTGAGIEPIVAEHIFTPFFTTKPEGEGTGLGLSMVAGLMSQHSGLVHAYSEPGMGSVFKIYFPVGGERRKRPRVELPVAELSSSTGETILIVEDDQALRRAASRVLQRAGYEVRVAEDGQAGLELFLETPEEFDLIVTDLVMPRMGGRELLARLREDGVDIPVVLTSGYLEQVKSDPVEDEGHVIYLPKPWAIEDLLRGVRNALEGAFEREPSTP